MVLRSIGYWILPVGFYYDQHFLSLLLMESSLQGGTQIDEYVKQRPLRFSFLTRIIQEGRARHKEEPEGSAKAILKRTILRENGERFGQSDRESFLMKGKMLSASKKPLDAQLQHFLVALNQRIGKQRQQIAKKVNEDTEKRTSYQEIFKNLREMRQKRPQEQEDGRSLNQCPMVRKLPQTLSHTAQKPYRQVSPPSSPPLPLRLPPPKPPLVVLRKGYLAYHPQISDLLKLARQNLKRPLSVPTCKQLTAKAILVADFQTLEPIAGLNTTISIEIASISKIMTCYLSLMICKKYGVELGQMTTRISEKAAQTPGTTAELEHGDIISIKDLLYGLMLPSGNDASVALAEILGKVIQRHRRKQTKKTPYQTYIAHMNLLAKQLELEQSWSNSSGLSNAPNYSTPQAILILTAIAMRHPVFKNIVSTRTHEIDVKNQRTGLTRKLTWRNTNRLLDSGWQGVKTGTTQTAGHCLMAKKDSLLICVFDCDTLARRFSECARLYQAYTTTK